MPGTSHERANVRGNVRRIPAPVNEIVTAGPIRLQRTLLDAVSQSHQRSVRRFRIVAEHGDDLESAHFAEFGGAQNDVRRTVFNHGKRVGRHGVMEHFKTFLLQRFRHALHKINVAVNQQHTQRGLGRSHDNASVAGIHSFWLAALRAIAFSRSKTSICSPLRFRCPVTYPSRSAAGTMIPATSSHAPCTGIAHFSGALDMCRSTTRKKRVEGESAPDNPGPKSSTGRILPRRKTTPAISGVVCGNVNISGEAISSATPSRRKAIRRVPTCRTTKEGTRLLFSALTRAPFRAAESQQDGSRSAAIRDSRLPTVAIPRQ